MDTIVRAAVVYLFLLLIFRLAGKRTLASITTFDLVLTLIISEAVQQALIDTDNSLTNALLLVVTLVGIDIGLSLVKQRSKAVARVVDGSPLVLIRDGTPLVDRMRNERVSPDDVLASARAQAGLQRLDEIRHAVLEVGGTITVVPVRDGER
ncbi:MAG TPA: YetF domain-containing protein [Gemmatimonadales bacterium]|nr:YetF domain-containing protein [Gemmatimonadales bacterium]